MLNDAKVCVQSLPQCQDISLWLVEPNAMRREFSAEEVNQIQEHPAYWGFCWASDQVLAREILANPHWVKDKKVMDFGAGSGVVAVACVMAGAKEVIRSEERRVGKECRAGRGAEHSSRRRHTRCGRDWSSDVCSSDLRS